MSSRMQAKWILFACIFVMSAVLAAPMSHADQIEVYFSPGSDHTGGSSSSMKTALINFINSATKTVEIAVFNLQDREIIEALNTLANAGTVTVKVIVDDQNYPVKTSDGTLSLSASATQKKDDKPEYEMHHKFVIVDRGDSAAAVWTGSANFNRPNLTTMNNNALIIRNSSVASAFGAEFDQMWAGNYHHSKSTASSQTNFTVAGVPIEVRFSPQDKPIDKLVSSIGTLTTSMYYAVYTYANPTLVSAMIAKKNSVGSSNLGIHDEMMSAFSSAYSDMNSAGMNVMKDLNNDVLHHKFAVLDGLTVFTGSVNFTVSGNDDNDENSVMIQDAAIAKAYLAEIARISNRTIGTITAADWVESVVVGSGTTTPVSTTLVEPAKGHVKAITYPNPFVLTHGATITFRSDPEASLSSVRIYSADGRLIYTMIPSTSATKVTWDGRNGRGELLSSGTYVMEMETKSSGTARGIFTLVR